MLIRRGDGEQALALADHIYQVRRRLLGEENPATLIAMSARGSALRVAGSLDEAYDVTLQAFELAAMALPDGHWRLASHQAPLARALKANGRDEEAIAEIEQARNVAAGELGGDHPFVQELTTDLTSWMTGSQ